jgi:hypothetical protein
VPFQLEWARDVIAQCRVTGAAPFVKQLGSAHGSKHTDPSTWPEDLRVREYPCSCVEQLIEALREYPPSPR